jgi:hypothetical protein
MPFAYPHACSKCSHRIIDTEGSFIPERVEEIAAALVQHLHSVAENFPEASNECKLLK